MDSAIEAYKTDAQREIEREREHYEIVGVCRFIRSFQFHPVRVRGGGGGPMSR